MQIAAKQGKLTKAVQDHFRLPEGNLLNDQRNAAAVVEVVNWQQKNLK